MTLATEVQIIEPLPPADVLRLGRSLLGATDAHPITTEGGWREGAGTIANQIGIGLPSMFIVHYGLDGPLQWTRWDPDTDDEVVVEGGEYCLSIHLDTGYSYGRGTGGGCSDLHAWLVQEIGLWAESRGARIRWHQEFTGEWFEGYTDVAELGDPDIGRLCPTPDYTSLPPLPGLAVG